MACHQAILRVLYAYFSGLRREECVDVSIPLNTVIKLEPKVYGCDEERFELLRKCPNPDGQKETRLKKSESVDDDPLFRDDDPPSH